jgi:hypothetical protein
MIQIQKRKILLFKFAAIFSMTFLCWFSIKIAGAGYPYQDRELDYFESLCEVSPGDWEMGCGWVCSWSGNDCYESSGFFCPCEC